MRMNRRDFLKGLLTLAGASAIGLPIELAQAEEAIAVPNWPTRPRGRLGAVRFDRNWYGLEDAQITIFRKHAPQVWDGGDKIMVARTNLVDAPVTIDFYLSQDPYRDIAEAPELEFEIDAGRWSFFGRGFPSLSGFSLMADGVPEFHVSLESSQKLSRYNREEKA